ncbi:hypothetical protein LY90DRAFT_506820 [Neocallimastix californiae]|jgi:hypothetical protein|uniref:t-SNARE coiled-coil homology domain-containing protein n=1 Tax=Neocallimastix californiae TaxID=1754190 RepID=A0A1Y2DAE0_9FUNG|nr:hypothetical protein LY90DRAFT_506820 [Neocallimastix californiae]|eukprot:ORY56240.1 hypothetical protein LY90DRAFT_506820 [Neocallimastix californiae]
MVREMKNLVSTSGTSFASLNNNYLSNGNSINSIKNFKSTEMNRDRRLPMGNGRVQRQSYYHRAQKNGIQQIVKETQYTNKFNKGFSVVPSTNPTNFDSINNLYQNICKNYDISGTSKSVAIDIPEVTPESETITKTEKLALVQGELDKIANIRDQITLIQNQLQDFNNEYYEDISSSSSTLASNGISYDKYKNFVDETRNVIDQLQQLSSFNLVSKPSKSYNSSTSFLKSAITSNNSTSQIYDLLSSTSFHSFAMFKKTFANNNIGSQPLKNYEKFVDLINENFYVQKEINKRNLNLIKTNQMFSVMNQQSLNDIQKIVKEGIVQVKELEKNLMNMEKSAITTSDEVELQTESIEKINQSIAKTSEILDKLRNDYKKELKEHETIIGYHKRMIDAIENSKRHVSVLTDVSIICFSIWLSNKIIISYPVELMAQSITQSKSGQKIISIIIKITLIILLTAQIRKFLKTNSKYNLIQYCFDLILNYHKKKFIENEDKAAKESLKSIKGSDETLVELE